MDTVVGEVVGVVVFRCVVAIGVESAKTIICPCVITYCDTIHSQQ